MRSACVEVWPPPARCQRMSSFRGVENGFDQGLRLVVIERRREPQAHDGQFARGDDGDALAVMTFHPESVGGDAKRGVRVLARREGVRAPEPYQAVSVLAAGGGDG